MKPQLNCKTSILLFFLIVFSPFSPFFSNFSCENQSTLSFPQLNNTWCTLIQKRKRRNKREQILHRQKEETMLLSQTLSVQRGSRIVQCNGDVEYRLNRKSVSQGTKCLRKMQVTRK
ncbi:hypothetical protein ASPWEDRAFT_337893 [Aspergillus wentii DTO 134E9]|uniref:Uncharacterized protein n=1 Tax=Aspergillus wentii DTO 134E9 TaxID=1073089 RepID=A0A1L9RUL7_ASPWE|nr:uncharacterized protein ASPWEDRAFT_337893 [Aspergillus wentii DTO 134E9]OJJ38609.1 hypothetical protein ASPWEDRAFT_337893 [Aspergillus wentii DTO 134E9]